MPKSQDILNSLHAISNDYVAVAIIWHFAFYLLFSLLLFKWTPSNKLLAILISLPVFSVSVFAWVSGNPFNGTIFLLTGLFIFIFGLRASDNSITSSSIPYFLIGIILVIYGLIYPHFLDTNHFIKYAIASPVGLVPCPTLSLLIGITLIFNGMGTNSIPLTFVIVGLFYAIFGIFKLGVTLDIGLLLGTLTLLVRYIFSFYHSTI